MRVLVSHELPRHFPWRSSLIGELVTPCEPIRHKASYAVLYPQWRFELPRYYPYCREASLCLNAHCNRLPLLGHQYFSQERMLMPLKLMLARLLIPPRRPAMRARPRPRTPREWVGAFVREQRGLHAEEIPRYAYPPKATNNGRCATFA